MPERPRHGPSTRGYEDCPGAHGGRQANLLSFNNLHDEGKGLILGWAARAGSDGIEEFESFIYAWIAFNAWMQCVTDPQISDREQLARLERTERLQNLFSELLSAPSFHEDAYHFSALWPIFSVTDVGDLVRQHRPRGAACSELIAFYSREAPNARRRPGCHLKHKDRIQLDWPHTLEAIYQVRCNLFHGNKSARELEDREIIKAAGAVLLPISQKVLSIG